MSEGLSGEQPPLSKTVGYAYRDDSQPPVFGTDPVIRPGTIVYDDVVVGDRFETGHFALVRERTEIGDDVLVGTKAVIDGRTTIGNDVSLQTDVYVPTETMIGDHVFCGPNAMLTNDPYPLRQDVDLEGPILEDHVSVGANATILPGVRIRRGSFVAAGALVTADVPSETLAVGVPARHEPLPEPLRGGNDGA
jgi:acetyltransferase-like isoleucine patch superfamily enzyme